ncbi:MAG: hypothetical protein LBU05_07205, partial [Bifidobacteriaceae bacterium]|nr:hypothetical protein [Bifidobacteriaceae bacterium]
RPAVELTKLDTAVGLPDGANPMAWFGERVFPTVQEALGEPNPVYSPLSVYLALGMVSDGAGGTTASQFAEVLAGDRDQVNDTASALLADYVTFEDGDENQPILKLADSIWIDDQIAIKEAFERDMVDLYRSSVFDVDFSQPDSAKPVNQWVKDRTNGLIDQLLDQGDTDGLLLYLVNALYFKGAWTSPAEPSATAPGRFELVDGRGVDVDMMTFDLWQASPLVLDDGSEGVLLPYGDGRFAMLAVMPAGGPEAVDWNGQVVAGWLERIKAAEPVPLMVRLPKWEADSGILDLIPVLRAAGLEDAFLDAADFRGISETALYISSVSHRAVVKVNEAGTEAAAATGICMLQAALAEPRTVEFNRPFVYSIIDTQTGLPLFLGALTDPTVK